MTIFIILYAVGCLLIISSVLILIHEVDSDNKLAITATILIMIGFIIVNKTHNIASEKYSKEFVNTVTAGINSLEEGITYQIVHTEMIYTNTSSNTTVINYYSILKDPDGVVLACRFDKKPPLEVAIKQKGELIPLSR